LSSSNFDVWVINAKFVAVQMKAIEWYSCL